MAIYTMENFSMLTAKPLDTKRVMTYGQWDTDDINGLTYPGQLYYDPETGWFRACGKEVDDPNNNIEMPVFGAGVDGVYIGNDTLYAAYNAPEITMYFNSSMDPIISMWNSDGNQLYYSGNAIDYEDIDYHIISSIDFSKSEILFGNSNTIRLNNNNKVVSTIGTGLDAYTPIIDQFIIGQYNNPNSNASFIIGNGTDNSHRSNILEATSSSIQINGDLITASNTIATINEIHSCDMVTKNMYFISEGDDVWTPDPAVRDYSSIVIRNSGADNFITNVKIGITEAFDSTAKLNIFIYTDTTTKTPTQYILQDYPIGKLGVDDVAMEELLVYLTNGSGNLYLTATITGLTDTNKGGLNLLIQYCNNW